MSYVVNMPRGNVLRRQTRKMVYDVLQFMKKEAENGLVFDLKAVQKRTAAATCVSERTVRRITIDATDPKAIDAFRTPGKKRRGKKRVTDINSIDLGIVRRIIHNYHITEKELPTIGHLLKKITNDIKFKGSATSLGHLVKSMGFKWKRADDKKKILIEHIDIRRKRIEYLEKMAKYREQGRAIVYADETYIDWKGQRIIIAHAGCKDGFIHNALLIYTAGTKPGEFCNNMTYQGYEKWVRTRLIPNLPPNSVVVINNAQYHNKLENESPTALAKKADMLSWLRERDIPCDENMYKPQLYKLISLHKDKCKKFFIDKLLQDNDHTGLRLPAYHTDLAPLEVVWTAVREYVAKKNVPENKHDIQKLVTEKLNSMACEWSTLCDQVITIEEEYRVSDPVIDKLTDQLKFDSIEYESDNESDKEDQKQDIENSDFSDNGSSSDEEASEMIIGS